MDYEVFHGRISFMARTYQRNDVALGEDVFTWVPFGDDTVEVDILFWSLVGDKVAEDVDNSSLWVGGADEDDCRSSGDE